MPVDEAFRIMMMMLYETRYTGWTIKYVHEGWHTEHGGTRSYYVDEKPLQAAGHVVRAPRCGAHRKKRTHKPLGMRLCQDGMTHEWGSICQWDLIVTLYAATIEMTVTEAADKLQKAIGRKVGRLQDR